jgi:hypothetical protein
MRRKKGRAWYVDLCGVGIVVEYCVSYIYFNEYMKCVIYWVVEQIGRIDFNVYSPDLMPVGIKDR